MISIAINALGAGRRRNKNHPSSPNTLSQTAANVRAELVSRVTNATKYMAERAAEIVADTRAMQPLP